MQISVTAVCTCASPSISDILRCWSPSCAWGHSALLFPPTLTSASRDGKVSFFFFFFFSLVFSFYTPTSHAHPLPCQLPGFRGVKACIIFHQLSVLISTKAAAMEQPLRLFAGLNFTDVRLLSFPRLNAAQRGWICKTNAAVCVWVSRVAQKGRFSQPMGWRKSALCRRQINQKQKPACRTYWLYGAEIVADFSVTLGTLQIEPGRCWGSDGLRWWIKYVVDSVFYKGEHFSALTSGSSSVTLPFMKLSRTLSRVWMCFQEHEEY